MKPAAPRLRRHGAPRPAPAPSPGRRPAAQGGAEATRAAAADGFQALFCGSLAAGVGAPAAVARARAPVLSPTPAVPARHEPPAVEPARLASPPLAAAGSGPAKPASTESAATLPAFPDAAAPGESAAAPSEPPPAVPVPTPALAADALVRAAVRPHAVHLRLDTETHGPLQVHLRVRDGEAHVRVDGPAAPALASEASELRAALATEGVTLAGFDASAPGSEPRGQDPEPEPPSDRPGRKARERTGRPPTADGGSIHLLA